MSRNLDIIMNLETKLVCSFPTGQFLINGFSETFKIDQNCQGDGIMLYVRKDILSKLLEDKISPT